VTKQRAIGHILPVAYWIKVTGTGEHPFNDDDWQPRRDRWVREQGGGSLFPRQPSIRRGGRLVLYAAGSAAAFGAGRLFAIEEVLSDEPEPSGHARCRAGARRGRWRWPPRRPPRASPASR